MADELVEINFDGVDRFLDEITALHASFNESVSKAYRSWVRFIFNDIVELTPQWSGNLASNWRISLSSSQESEDTIANKALMWPPGPYVKPFFRGMDPAVQISEARFDNFEQFGYSQQVFIYNPTEIAQQVEDHSIHLRAVNLLDGRVAMLAHAQALYSMYMPPVELL